MFAQSAALPQPTAFPTPQAYLDKVVRPILHEANDRLGTLAGTINGLTNEVRLHADRLLGSVPVDAQSGQTPPVPTASRAAGTANELLDRLSALEEMAQELGVEVARLSRV